MLGKLVADSGAAQRITSSLVGLFGIGRVQWALMLTAFIVGVPLFYDVGFVIMMPIVFAVVASTKVPLLHVGLPTLAALSVTHGYLPPHPAPTAIAATFHADIGKTLVYGIIIAIPAIILAGPVLLKGLKKIDARPMEEFTGAATVAAYALPEGNGMRRALGWAGNPPIAMLLSLLRAIYTLGVARGRTMTDIMASLTHSISSLTSDRVA
ncbi:MAG: SLC13 family permease [Acidobacteria bacterium]|nr:SLC13 family permease [Acidobacteriota bacterium]